MDLAKRNTATKPVTIEFDEQELHVGYYPRAVKLKDLLEQPDPTDQPAVVRFTATILSRRLASWDLTDGDTPIGTDYASLIELDPELVNAVLEAINKDGSPGEATGSN